MAAPTLDELISPAGIKVAPRGRGVSRSLRRLEALASAALVGVAAAGSAEPATPLLLCLGLAGLALLGDPRRSRR